MNEKREFEEMKVYKNKRARHLYGVYCYYAPHKDNLGFNAYDGQEIALISAGQAQKLLDEGVLMESYRVHSGVKPGDHFYMWAGKYAKMCRVLNGGNNAR